jgi:hypothetical protein
MGIPLPTRRRRRGAPMRPSASAPRLPGGPPNDARGRPGAPQMRSPTTWPNLQPIARTGQREIMERRHQTLRRSHRGAPFPPRRGPAARGRTCRQRARASARRAGLSPDPAQRLADRRRSATPRRGRQGPDQADLARAATLNARDRATSRLRMGCMPTARPAAIPPTVRRLTAGVPDRETELDSGAALELVESGASAPRLRVLAVCRSVAMNSPYARSPSRAGKRSTCQRSLSFAPSPGRRRLAGRRPDTHPSSRSREPA